ncbi:rplX protein [Lapidilactobacillus concavus DSM 17758]|jgi:large subunit ribosomal protein L24|uniref:Large ribosomal subunit protein uL24 n=1 Tax=Lapidilactobacillus concavus DSM 17758 TaxID=1423735 RepID=A0A0R1W4K9_9LACO|nr:50S ribosomal protein L24 [Lapidilactobacillus concavus]KRM12718.1 rplX protein [Lapidilactobacillus concavus DSM 17758]GEL13245.1 50S ribosomal protein L24 [Lapidilactobacillus concavus]
MFVKTGDKVKVISGKDKGKEGKVLKVLAKKDRVIVEGVNVAKKHQKPSNADPQGGIKDQEVAIHVSNVMLIDPSTNQPTRIGYQVVDGKKVRVSKKTGEPIDKVVKTDK